jgi:hypothetical protein
MPDTLRVQGANIIKMNHLSLPQKAVGSLLIQV